MKVKTSVVSKDKTTNKVNLHIMKSPFIGSVDVGSADLIVTVTDDALFDSFVAGQECEVEVDGAPSGGAGETSGDSTTTTGETTMPENPVSGAATSQTDSATGTTQADVAAAARAAAAAAQTAASQAATAANATGAVAQQEAVGDISPTEAYTINLKRLVENALTSDTILNQVSTGIAQRLTTQALDFDQQMKAIALQNLQLGQTALANAVALANRVNNGSADLDLKAKVNSSDFEQRLKANGLDGDVRAKGNDESQDKQMDACSTSERERTVRHGDLAIDRQWNVDEVAELVAKTPVFQDAIAGAVAKGVADAVAEKKTV